MLIAQVSDLHAQQGAASVEALRRACVFLSRLRPDASMFSGDLVEEPTEENYALVRGLLAGLAFPVFVIPGNADDRSAMRAVLEGHDYWPRMGAMNFAVELGGKARLIGFDVTVAGEKFGVATAEGLEWLAAECACLPRLPTLIMMHQHPFRTGIDALDDNMCRNSEELADVLGRSRGPVGAVTCGHGHRTIFTTFGGVPAMMCPALAAANPLLLDGYGEPEATDVPGLLVHHVRDGRITSHAVSLA